MQLLLGLAHALFIVWLIISTNYGKILQLTSSNVISVWLTAPETAEIYLRSEEWGQEVKRNSVPSRTKTSRHKHSAANPTQTELSSRSIRLIFYQHIFNFTGSISLNFRTSWFFFALLVCLTADLSHWGSAEPNKGFFFLKMHFCGWTLVHSSTGGPLEKSRLELEA